MIVKNLFEWMTCGSIYSMDYLLYGKWQMELPTYYRKMYDNGTSVGGLFILCYTENVVTYLFIKIKNYIVLDGQHTDTSWKMVSSIMHSVIDYL